MEKETKTAEQRGEGMAFDKAKYDEEWKNANRDKVIIRVPKGKNAELKEIADRMGKTKGRFIKDALYYYMDALGEERINLE